MKGGQCAPGAATTNAMPRPIIRRVNIRLTMCCPLKTTGALENSLEILPSPASLPNAMTEPENVIAPTNVPMNNSTRLPAGMGSPTLNAIGLLTTAMAMSTAARPTSECIAATSSGICVICTRCATSQPTMPPRASAPIVRSMRWVIASVVSTASVMPAMPNRLPRRAVSGLERPLRARMKSTLATR